MKRWRQTLSAGWTALTAALSPRALMRDWKRWGLPAFASMTAPWVRRLVGLELISPFYQPGLDMFATTVAAIAGLVSFALLKEAGAGRRVRALVVAIGVSFASFLVCLAFNQTIGVFFTLEPWQRFIVHLVWWIAYLAMFIAVAVTLTTAFLLARPRAKGAAR